ncbi:hypothetical protein B0H14DRAFT_3599202 [Mycena olivaceomarginata]|nr:hypothetical protein B0H14DRAFT_3599202 [Mycena olivaceomarginata]
MSGIHWWTGFDSPPLHSFFLVDITVFRTPRRAGQEYMQNAPVVYGTPTESRISDWAESNNIKFKFKGVCGYKRTIPKSVEQGKARQGEARKERTRTNVYGYSWIGLGWGKKDHMYKITSSAIERVGLAFSSCCDWGGEEHRGVECECSEGGRGRNANADNERLKGKGEPGRTLARAGGDGVRPGGGGTCELRRRGGRGRGKRGAARGDEPFGEEDARVVDLLLFRLLVLSDSELRRHELDLVALGLAAQLSQLNVQLPRPCAYERRDGDAPASPRAAYPGASGVAGVVVVGGVIRIHARQHLAAPMHHPHRALRERVRVLVYARPIERGVSGGGRDERVRAVGGGVAGGVREGAGGGEGGGGGRGRGVRGVGRAGALGRVGVGVGGGRRGAGGAGRGGSSMCGGRARAAGRGRQSRGRRRRGNSARLKGERRVGDIDDDLDDEGECMAGVEGKDEEGK